MCTFLHTISYVCSCKTDYIILTIQCVYFYIRLRTIYSCKTCKTRIKQLRNYKKNHGVLRGPQLNEATWVNKTIHVVNCEFWYTWHSEPTRLTCVEVWTYQGAPHGQPEQWLPAASGRLCPPPLLSWSCTHRFSLSPDPLKNTQLPTDLQQMLTWSKLSPPVYRLHTPISSVMKYKPWCHRGTNV